MLERKIVVGGWIFDSGAARNEGVSFHSLLPRREVTTHEVGVRVEVKTLSSRGVFHRIGETWTTDAPYRKAANKYAQRKAEGYLILEMEAARTTAVAQFRGVVSGRV